jgi:hypothetical protein
MRLRIVAAVTALCASLATAAGVQAKDLVRPSSVSGAVMIEPAVSSGIVLGCRTPAVALSGAVGRSGAGHLVRSRPGAAIRKWDFEFAAAPRRRAAAELRCLSLRLPAGVRQAELRVNTVRSDVLALPARTSRSVKLRCDRGYVPTGYGLEREGEIAIGAAVPGPRSWRFQIENRGAAEARAKLRIRCLQRSVSADSTDGETTLRFAVRRATFADSVRSGAGVSHSCGQREYSLATGFESAPASGVSVTSNRPAGRRGGRWSFGGVAGNAQVSTYLVCLGLGSRFR